MALKKQSPERLPRGAVVRSVLIPLDARTDKAVRALTKAAPELSQAEVLRRALRDAAALLRGRLL